MNKMNLREISNKNLIELKPIKKERIKLNL